MRRTAFILALLVSATAAADTPPTPPAPFLDRSIVTLPGSTGDYRLANVRYEPDRWMQGVISRWVVNAAPGDLRLTMFVHPMGRTDEANAVGLQIAEVAHFMDEAVKQGVYTDLVVGAREPFAVVAPSLAEAGEATERAMPQPEPDIAAGDDSAALAAALPAPNTHGQRQAFAFTEKGVAMRSLDYVFYRQLFAFKVRVSAPVDSMDETLFSALADTAVRKLVPRVEVRNYGQCGKLELQGEDGAKPSARQLVLAMARIRADNCAPAEDAESQDEPGDGRRVEIVYPPDAWRTGS